MMKNKIQIEDMSNMKAGIDGLKKVSMTPRQQGEVFHNLMKYAEKNPATAKDSMLAMILKPLRSLFSLISWR